MKNINLKQIVFAVLVMFLGCTLAVNAQTETEKQMKELKARRALAKEKIGQGGSDKLGALEKDAEFSQDPCTLFDDDEWYTAFNQKEGRKGDPKLANTLLEFCKQQLFLKFEGAYKAVQRDYFDAMDVDAQSTAAAHFESAGENVVNKILKETRECCRETSNQPDERGNIIMYMAIKISKQEMINKITEELSQDKQLGVRFNENKFRESAMKRFEMDKDNQNDIQE